LSPFRQLVYNALATVEEPDLKKDLVTLGMVREVEADELAVRIVVNLTTPACPLKEVIRSRCVAAINAFYAQAALAEPTITVDMTADVTSGRQANAGPVLPGVRNLIAVSSGKGGVGKSTVTANLAYALAATGARVGLIDADISGPSIPTMFGCEDEQPGLIQVEGQNRIVPVERYGVKLLSIGFLTPPESAVVWRGPMMSSALRQFIQDTEWGELDYLLFDMPPGTSDIHLTVVTTVPLTGAIIVTTPQKVALADAQKAVSMFRQPQINVEILGVVENMSWFTPAELPDSKYYLFGRDGGARLAEHNGVPLLGQVPLVQSIREAGDDGLPIVATGGLVADAFKALAASVAQVVAMRNAGIPAAVEA
jgi:ATP-binding protein involved in chromosome partitioning